ncbi:MAG: flagellar biosynthesis protein FlhF [Dethiobacteria bacterium]|jgi:flagellar biosynthesis protein FlhF|nr:flagellar biosynthesis protein FlhF [Bacillota bacterium]HPZ41048.1 flagellar biosynthesis protein FlhF [Bacillota bacterium]HQD52138.1 flagellar biosynthesis protein FlhF [Bacillota bacterium]
MKVRKYYSKNQVEGFLKVKKELGPEAIILQTRKVRARGLKGLFTPPRVEIIAALDTRDSARANGSESGSSGQLETELKELKKMVQSLVEETAKNGSNSQGEAKSHNCWHNFLQNQDIDPVLIEDLFTSLSADPSGPGLNWASMVLALQEQFSKRLTVTPEKEYRNLVLIGPTGVGKTTTLAKLAARYALTFKEKVGLITIDHFRIGAVEQLKAYAEIIDLPLEVVVTPSDLTEALKRLEYCDRILVDTAGRSTGNLNQIDELSSYIELLQPAEIHLVISATTRWQDIRYITGSFMKLQYNRLLITKLDETVSYGAILNGAYHTSQPLVYLTDGQSVPDCLKLAREMDWAELFLGGRR